MLVKSGRYGKFAACPSYPECKNTKPLNGTSAKAAVPKMQRQQHPLSLSTQTSNARNVAATWCLEQDVMAAFTLHQLPGARFTKQKNQTIGVKCPKCDGDIVVKYGKNKTLFYGCSRYPECDFSSWDQPTAEKCPTSGGILYRKKGKTFLYAI